MSNVARGLGRERPAAQDDDRLRLRQLTRRNMAPFPRARQSQRDPTVAANQQQRQRQQEQRRAQARPAHDQGDRHQGACQPQRVHQGREDFREVEEHGLAMITEISKRGVFEG